MKFRKVLIAMLAVFSLAVISYASDSAPPLKKAPTEQCAVQVALQAITPATADVTGYVSFCEVTNQMPSFKQYPVRVSGRSYCTPTAKLSGKWRSTTRHVTIGSLKIIADT